MAKKVEYNKVRGLRLTDKTWNGFCDLKARDKDWELFIKELLDMVAFFKNLKQ